MHEVVNGLLTRPDKRKVPVIIIPNGSGNDFAGCLGLKSVEMAIDWLIKGDVISIDVNKVLFDADNEDEIPEEERH